MKCVIDLKETTVNKITPHTTRRAALIALVGMILWAMPAAADVETADVASGFFEHNFGLGYRFVEDHGNPVRAREYDSLISGTTGKAKIAVVDDWGHLRLEGTYLNKKDFDAEAEINIGNDVRTELRTMSLFHNLDHVDIIRTPPDSHYAFTDDNPGDSYGIQVQENFAKVSVKPWEYPAHVKLSYWSWEKKGSEQVRFVDENCTSCHIQSKSRQANRITEEVKGSVDAHLGAIEVEVEQVFRQFRDEVPTPTNSFDFHMLRNGANNPYEHDEDPESQIMTTTLRIHNSLAGGLNTAASGSYSERKNESKVTDVRPVTSDTVVKTGALDVTWIPVGPFTLSMRGRYLDLENKTTEQLTSDANVVTPFPVRQNINREQYSGSTSLVFRPSHKASIKLDYSYKELRRSRTGGPMSFNSGLFGPRADDLVWELPQNEIHTATKLSFLLRPLGNGRLKIRNWYEYRYVDEMAYGTSLEEGMTGYLSIDANPSPSVGMHFSGRYVYENGTGLETTIQAEGTGFSPETTFLRDRERRDLSLTAMLWLQPSSATTLNLHYGYLDSDIIEDLVLGHDRDTDPASPDRDFAIAADDSEFEQTTHTASANLNWRLIPTLLATTSARYIQSEGLFSPEFAPRDLDYRDIPGIVTVTSAGFSNVSKLYLRQYGATAGLEWDGPSDIHYGVRYTFDKYDDKYNESIDGEVETYMATVAKRW